MDKNDYIMKEALEAAAAIYVSKFNRRIGLTIVNEKSLIKHEAFSSAIATAVDIAIQRILTEAAGALSTREINHWSEAYEFLKEFAWNRRYKNGKSEGLLGRDEPSNESDEA